MAGHRTWAAFAIAGLVLAGCSFADEALVPPRYVQVAPEHREQHHGGHEQDRDRMGLVAEIGDRLAWRDHIAHHVEPQRVRHDVDADDQRQVDPHQDTTEEPMLFFQHA